MSSGLVYFVHKSIAKSYLGCYLGLAATQDKRSFTVNYIEHTMFHDIWYLTSSYLFHVIPDFHM